VTNGPSLAAIRRLQEAQADSILRTPVVRCASLENQFGGDTTVYAKLEFLQRTGTFKARGALSVLNSLTAEQRERGVTAVSAGNHAIATAFASRTMGVSAKVVMTASANRVRIDACRSYGADVVLADDVHEAFEVADRIQKEEGRFFVHPFEGVDVATGTGTLGIELCEQCDSFDTLVVPVGGGGLIAGISNAVKQIRPDCDIIGVEPEGADSMHRSFAAGEPQAIDKVRTIADSLGAPFAMPYSFGLCRDNVDRLVLIDDIQLRQAMGLLFDVMKIAVEPACAASTAALFGPLRDKLRGKTVMLVFCGSNIDWATFQSQAIFGNSSC